MKEYRVQFKNSWSEKNGDEVTERVMTLEDAQRFIAEHPETEYVVLERSAGDPPSIWSLLAPEDAG
ncbi:ABC-type nitrate/sulfonate/bicarbonate transport system substrate-binding protein [Microbacterium sp. SORGH_AS428]|uniref:hypothetical protein n=1 Tax=Microbacterium sp. SORGH_AS_0428 TaxID=3041788 RepID=UPI0028557825|nr:hypothetical protein [Microbacterium sp. SORGH_AS_0428]MDR6200255.1 ABC-type nitrate/sulfonate/bicarbonate transport system substrate-binding protein [Microbacterium sp. SORGH_AS_0428]